MKIEAAGIIGSSYTAGAAAELLLKKGFQLRVFDNFKASLRSFSARMEWFAQHSETPVNLANMETVQDISLLSGADIIIETSTASDEERLKLLKPLAEKLSPDCIIALRCGTKKISPIARQLKNPGRVLGINLARPIRKTALAEIVRTDDSSDAAIAGAMEILRLLGKTPVISHDSPGAVAERMRRCYISAAIAFLETGKGFPKNIDDAVKSATGAMLGPLELADIVGLDADTSCATYIYEQLSKPERLKPSPMENRLVQYGQLGLKTEAGFYLYEDGEKAGHNPILKDIVPYLGISTAGPQIIAAEIVRKMAEEAKILSGEALVSEFDIETAIKLSLGWQKGPFALLREMENIIKNSAEQKRDQWGDAI